MDLSQQQRGSGLPSQVPMVTPEQLAALQQLATACQNNVGNDSTEDSDEEEPSEEALKRWVARRRVM